MVLPAAYHSREHAFIKHKILELYLKKLFMIVGQWNDELIYIDCFSGPWLSEDSQIKDTSICIALTEMAKCKAQLDNIRSYPVKCRAMFVEKDDKAFEKLQRYLEERTPDGIEAHCLHGDFVNLRDTILTWCGSSGFAFFFIDPKGWKEVRPSILKPILERPRSEFLINFMYEFINRFITLDQVKEDIIDFFGTVPDLNDISAKERENILISLYRNRLKEIITQKYKHARFSDVRIMHPDKERAKYYLIYITCHPKGIIVFSEISEKCELIQQSIRIESKLRKINDSSGQVDIFGIEQTESTAIIDIDLSNEIQCFWLQIIDKKEQRFGIDELAFYIEATGYMPSQLQEALGVLIKDGLVENMDDLKKKRRTKHIYFEKNERLRCIK